MEIVLFMLLLAVWAALVVPSVIRSRRERSVTTRPPATSAQARQAAEHRARVLARRKTALIALAVAVIGTLAAAILTGSWPILIASLVVDVLLAVYIAILLQVKQTKVAGPPPTHGEPGGEGEFRVRDR